MFKVSFYLGIAAGLAPAVNISAQNIRQETAPEIRSVNGIWVRTQEGSAEAMPRLQVSSQVRVVLRGIEGGNRVKFRLTQRVKAPNEQQAAARLVGVASIESASGVTVVNAQRSPWFSTLELDAPPQVKTASLEIQRGGIDVQHFHGSLLARTPAGDIHAGDIDGPVAAHTGGGQIRLGRMGGSVECSTGAGSITVDSAAGELRCQTAGGEIFVKQARGPVWVSSGGGDIEVDNAAGSVEAHSMRGAIQVGQAGGVVAADTRGGAIRVGSAAGVRVESADGPVRLMGASGALSVSAAMGSILAELLAGARLQDSSLVAPSGDITVMIPSNVAVSVMAANENGGMPHIESDFSSVRMQALHFSQPPLAQGIINGGGPVLLLSGGGMIYLRRMR